MNKFITVLGIGSICLLLGGCQAKVENENEDSADAKPHVEAESQVAAGRYIIMVSGCNDCHTPGFIENSEMPESEWLTGSPVGWRGPWGTTYAQNLRLRIENYTEEQWVTMAHTRNTMPPMAWFSLNNMSEEDLRAIYAYVKSLGPKGEHVPATVPAGEEPKTPYVSLMPQNMPTDSTAAQ